MTIAQSISDYKKSLNYKIEALNKGSESLKNVSPTRIRETYDPRMEIYTNAEVENENSKVLLETNIKELEECKSLLEEIGKIFKDRKNRVNKGKIGTLEGLAREEINKKNIPIDEYGETVMDQDYDELEEIKWNGGKNIGKRNKTKRKKYTVKNYNNKSNGGNEYNASQSAWRAIRRY
jgi:hypothetical protein